MFDYVEGELAGKSPAQAVIAAGGIGYCLTIPLSTYDRLPDDGRARLLAYLYVREDVLRLYGFATEDERRLFGRLIGVQGIGPNTALAVLNGTSVEAFRRAVAEQDLAAVARIKGIGRKTAERIVVELKTEMQRELLERAGGEAGAPVNDAIAALTALGYRRSASEKAVSAALEKIGRAASLEDVIREALQQA